MKNTEKNWKIKRFYTVGHKLFIIWKSPATKCEHTATMWCNFGSWISPNSANVVNNKINYILLRNFTAWQNLHENITILLTGTVRVAAQCANFNIFLNTWRNKKEQKFNSMSCILKADYNNTLQLKSKLKCSKKNPATHQKQLKKEQKVKMQVCKVRAIVQD